MSVRSAGLDLLVRDESVPVIAGTGCVALSEHEVRCSRPAGVHTELGRGDDRLVLDPDPPSAHPKLPLTFSVDGTIKAGANPVAGDGNDIVIGSPFDDVLLTGDGADQVSGGDGNDVLQSDGLASVLRGGAGQDRLIPGGAAYGEEGHDVLFSNAGPNLLNGGPGSDIVSYFYRSEPMTVDLRRADGQGALSENDRYEEIERVVGGSGDDEITGTEGSDELTGGAGSDRLFGLGGDDLLIDGDAHFFGIEQADLYDGGTGRDAADYSNRGARVVIDLRQATGQGASNENDAFASIESAATGSGSDLLIGNAKVNHLVAGAGDDDIQSADAVEDLVSCSLGTDTLRRDVRDLAQEDAACETVLTAPSSGEPARAPGDRDGDDRLDDADPCPDTAGIDGCPFGTSPPGQPTASDGAGSPAHDSAGATDHGQPTAGQRPVTIGTPPQRDVADSPAKSTIRLGRRSLRLRDGRIRVRLRCLAARRCQGTLRLTRGRTNLGRRTFSIAAGRSTNVSVTVTRSARRALRRSVPTRIRVTATTRGAETITVTVPLDTR